MFLLLSEEIVIVFSPQFFQPYTHTFFPKQPQNRSFGKFLTQAIVNSQGVMSTSFQNTSRKRVLEILLRPTQLILCICFQLLTIFTFFPGHLTCRNLRSVSYDSEQISVFRCHLLYIEFLTLERLTAVVYLQP